MSIFYTDEHGQIRYCAGVKIVNFTGNFNRGWRAGFVSRKPGAGTTLVVTGSEGSKTEIAAFQRPSIRDVGDLLVDDAWGIDGRHDAPQHLRGKYVD